MIQQPRDALSLSGSGIYRGTNMNVSVSSSPKGGEAPPKLLYYTSDGEASGPCNPSPPSSSSSSRQSSPVFSFNPSIFSSTTSSDSSSASRSSTPSVGPSTRFPLSSQSSPSSQRYSRIQVSSLLADPQHRTYQLDVIQQPQRTAEFGMANLSRLPITPPIVVRLVVRGPSGNLVVPEDELPFLIAHLSLLSEDGSTSLDVGSHIGLGNQVPLLYGNLVSSVDQLDDLQGNPGLFFLFSDVSVRWSGRYQLRITLSRISSVSASGDLNVAENGTHLCSTQTTTFDVVARSDYTAAPLTRLTQTFIRQGARMSFLP